MPFNLIVAPVTILLFTDPNKFQSFLTENGKEKCDGIDNDTYGLTWREVINRKVLVYLDFNLDSEETRSTIVHESIHVLNVIKKYMDLGYNEEVDAYGIDSIFQELVNQARVHGINI